jgi:hypothetical protein
VTTTEDTEDPTEDTEDPTEDTEDPTEDTEDPTEDTEVTEKGLGLRRRGSPVRFALGVFLCLAAIAVTMYGFVRLATVLEQGGYGTPAQRDALVVLGLAGALFAAGIATIIWDVSERYEKPRA